MSKAVKSIAKVALPVIGAAVGGPVGAAIGGAVAGAAGGGGIKGAIIGGATGYIGGGGLSGVVGSPAYSLAPGISGPVSVGTGILGATGAVGRSVAPVLNSITTGLGTIKEFGDVGGSVGTGAGTAETANPLLTLANVGTTAYSAYAGQQAADKAAKQQVEATNKAIAQATSGLQPYTSAGADTVNGLKQLVNDPQAQAAYIQSNPFYQTLADDAKKKLFANSAAKGKVGSGGTAAALQNSLLLLGKDLINNDISQRQSLVNTGLNAATNLANGNSDLLTQQGNARAAGTIGGYNAVTGALNNGIATQTGLYGLEKGVQL